MLFHSIDAWPLFQESVHCPVREQKVWIFHPRHNPGHMRLSRWIHLPSVTPSSMSVPPGMNTPYPNNDSDDTNKLLEEIEVGDWKLQLSGHFHGWLEISGHFHGDFHRWVLLCNHCQGLVAARRGLFEGVCLSNTRNNCVYDLPPIRTLGIFLTSPSWWLASSISSYQQCR